MPTRRTGGVATSTAFSTAAVTVTIPAANCLVVAWVSHNDLTPSGCNAGASAMTQQGAEQASFFGGGLRCYTFWNPAAGSLTVTPQGSGSGGSCTCTVEVWDDLDTSTPFDGVAGANSGGAANSVSLDISSRVGDTTLSGIVMSGSFTRDGALTAHETSAAGNYSEIAGSQSRAGVAGATAHAFTMTALSAAVIGLNLRAAAGGGPTGTPAGGRYRAIGAAR